MKSEPGNYSIDDFQKEGTTLWTGVRNYQARNFMINEMQVGDLCFFYHSNAEPSCLVGLGEVLKVAVVDPTQFDRKSQYFDEKSSPEKPRWRCVQLKFLKKFGRFLPLAELRTKKSLLGLELLKQGSRLSVQPVSDKHAKSLLLLTQ